MTVSYAPPAASPLQDDDGNRVAAFTDFAVQNLAPLPPALESAKVITNTIVLTFDENLDQDSVPAASAFTVKINGQPLTGAAVRFALDTAAVTVLGTVQYGDVVTVSYTPPATNPLQDAGGNRVLAFTDVMVRNDAAPPASAPPALESARVSTNTIVLTFDENLDQDSMPAASAFTVKINGQPLTGAAVRFALDTAAVTVLGTVQYGDVVTVSYTPPATNPLQDAGGNRVLAFTDVMVRNVAAPPASLPPKLVDAEVITANSVALDFDEDLDGDSTPATSAFTVKVNGRTRTVAGVYLLAIDQDSVRLTIDGGVRHGDVVTVSYAPTATNALQDAGGNRVAAFTDIMVRNDLPISDGAPATPPTIAYVLISSEPADGEYVTGDRIEVTVTFDQPVSNSGSAFIALNIGGAVRHGFLTERVSGVRALVFRTNELLATDVDDDGVSIVANSLALAGGATIRNASGLDAVLTHRALADDPGHRVNVAPVLVGARILPGQTPYLILKFDEALDRASQPGTSAFTVTINDQTRSLTHTAFTTGSNNEFTVFLQPTQVDVVHGDKVTVSYVPPAANGLQDAAGNRVVAFTEVRVNVPRTAGDPPANPEAEVIDGNTVAVNFDGDLDTDSRPATSAFTVTVNDRTRTVAAVHLPEFDRDSVRLTVSGGIRHGDVVTVSYEKPAANRLQDAAGNPVAAFTDITARNDLPATITLTADPSSVKEGAGPTTITVTATLDGDTQPAQTTVNVQVAGGTATVADDFAAVSGFTITIPANTASATGAFTLTPVDDGAVERGVETITVSGTAVGFDVHPATVTITDDDEPTVTIVAVVPVSDLDRTEGDAAVFTLTRTGSTANALTVTVRVSESGAMVEASDEGEKAVTFAKNSATATHRVPTRSDSTGEDDSTITVAVIAGAGYVPGAGGPGEANPGSAGLTILDNDFTPVNVVFGVPEKVGEDAGTLEISMTATTTVNRRPRQDFGLTLVSRSGAARSPEDYDPMSDTYLFAAGAAWTATIDGDGNPVFTQTETASVTIHDDMLDEDDESFSLRLQRVSGTPAGCIAATRRHRDDRRQRRRAGGEREGRDPERRGGCGHGIGVRGAGHGERAGDESGGGDRERYGGGGGGLHGAGAGRRADLPGGEHGAVHRCHRDRR